jgi:hypothetical protein
VKYRVKLKTTVTAWVEVEIPPGTVAGYEELGGDVREVAADDAVDAESHQLRDRLAAADLEHGPIELAHEELDESVEAVA